MIHVIAYVTDNLMSSSRWIVRLARISPTVHDKMACSLPNSRGRLDPVVH